MKSFLKKTGFIPIEGTRGPWPQNLSTGDIGYNFNRRQRPLLPLKNPYERYILFLYLVLICSFDFNLLYIVILFNLGFSAFAQVDL